MGYQSYLGIGDESTWDTPVAAAEYIEVLNESLKWVKPQKAYGGARSLTYPMYFPDKTLIEGGFNAELFYEGFLLLWRQLMGGYAHSLTVDSNHQHVFTIAQAVRTGLTLRVGKDKEEHIFGGCKLNKATFDFVVDEPAKVAIDVLGGSQTSGAVGSPTLPASSLLIKPSHITVKYDAATIECKSAQIVFDNGLGSDRRALGSAKILEPLRAGPYMCSGKVEMEFLNTTDYDLFEAVTEKQITVLCEGDSISGADVYTFQLYCERCVFMGDTPNVEGQGPIPMTMNFQAFYDSGAAKDVLEITCINTEASL